MESKKNVSGWKFPYDMIRRKNKVLQKYLLIYWIKYLETTQKKSKQQTKCFFDCFRSKVWEMKKMNEINNIKFIILFFFFFWMQFAAGHFIMGGSKFVIYYTSHAQHPKREHKKNRFMVAILRNGKIKSSLLFGVCSLMMFTSV